MLTFGSYIPATRR